MNRRNQSWTRIVAVFGLLICSLPAWSQYNQSFGAYPVLTVDKLVLHDAARNKDVPLKIYYPDGSGPFPVVIFSHGALASKECYSGFGRYWASFGYVSIHPSHGDSIADSGFRGTLQQAISDPRAWENRPKDISFVINSLPEIEKLAPQLAGKLDRRRIGVGGHSFGAYTAELIGGMTILLPGKEEPQSFTDRRVSAILLLSPEGEGKMGLTADSWSNLRLPMLLMYGSRDFGAWGEDPDWRSEAFRKAPPGDKYQVEVEGGTHMGFAGASLKSSYKRVFQCAKFETLAFWDAYLKQDAQAKQYLKSDGLRNFSADVRFSSK